LTLKGPLPKLKTVRENTVAQETPTFPEDDEILSKLVDPTDAQAYANLMENAHRDGISAADFVREEPKRTSRKTIRVLCLKDQKRSIKAIVSSVVKSLWDRPATNPETAFDAMLGPGGHRFGNKDKPDPNRPNGRG
jgi:hypothetical protein